MKFEFEEQLEIDDALKHRHPLYYAKMSPSEIFPFLKYCKRKKTTEE